MTEETVEKSQRKRWLIIHHLEPCWEESYSSMGYSFDFMLGKTQSYLEYFAHNYEKVILTRFDSSDFRGEEDAFQELPKFVDRVYEYSHGWEAPNNDLEFLQENGSAIDEYGELFALGTIHSDAVWIPDWMQELPKDVEYNICGAFRGECLGDLEDAFDFLGLNYDILPNLSV